MLSKLTHLLIILAVIFAGIFCVTFTTVTQTVPLILILLCAVFTVLSAYSRKGAKTVPPYFYVGVLVVSYFGVRAYLSPVSSFAMQDLFLILGMSLCFIISSLNEDKGKFVKVILTAFILLTVLNLLMFIPAVNEYRDGLLNFARGDLKTGLFNHRNFFSQFMAMSSCSLIAFSVFGKISKASRLVIFLLGILSAGAVVVSMARGSIFGLLFGLSIIFGLFLVCNIDSLSKKAKSLVMVIMLIVISLSFLGLGKVVEARAGPGNSISSNVRNTYFSMAIDQIPDAPFLGSGSRSVEYKSYEYWSPKLYKQFDFKFTHNEYLQAIADYGIVGFVLMMGIILYSIARIVMNISSSISSRAPICLEVMVLGAMSVLLVSSFFSFPLHSFINVIFLGLLAGLIPSRKQAHRSKNLVSKCGTKSIFAVASIFIMGAAVYLMPNLNRELKAGMIYVDNGITVDDQNWKLQEDTKGQWFNALIEVTKVSPDYDRLARLGVLYLDKYDKETEPDAKNGYLESSLICFKKAKKLNPFDPTVRLNIAYYYEQKGNLARANEEYREMDKYASHREDAFSFLIRAMTLNKNMAESYVRKNQVEDAISAYDESIKYAKRRMRRTGGFDGNFIYAYRQILFNYSTLLITHQDFEKYDEIYQLNEELGSDLLNHYQGRKQQVSHSKNLIILAKLYWSVTEERPEVVLKHVEQAEKQYLQLLKYRSGKETREWREGMDEIQAIKKYLLLKINDQ